LTSAGDHEGHTLIWNTYWRSIKGLHEFARCTAHRAGQRAYLKDNKFPYIGIMHELYFARADATETLYDRFPPFGLGRFNRVLLILSAGLITFRRLNQDRCQRERWYRS
jgi:hypothetical protein